MCTLVSTHACIWCSRQLLCRRVFFLVPFVSEMVDVPCTRSLSPPPCERLHKPGSLPSEATVARCVDRRDTLILAKALHAAVEKESRSQLWSDQVDEPSLPIELPYTSDPERHYMPGGVDPVTHTATDATSGATHRPPRWAV